VLHTIGITGTGPVMTGRRSVDDLNERIAPTSALTSSFLPDLRSRMRVSRKSELGRSRDLRSFFGSDFKAEAGSPIGI
jgi:hypothetical protein